MPRCRCDITTPEVHEGAGRLVVHDLAGRHGHERVVTIVFTDRQIAYLNERMAAVGKARPLGRVGETHFGGAFREGLDVR